MMKIICKSLPIGALGLVLMQTFCAPAHAAPLTPPAELYGRKIAAPDKAGDQLQAAIDDLQQTLQAMTGQKFSVGKEYSGSGILLARTQSPDAPADAIAKLKGKGREPFVIRSKDASQLWIIANGEEGLSHGIYFYLEQLGCHWFLPNDKWTVIPQRRDVAIKMDRLIAPAFKARTFFGTGGYGPAAVYDPKYDAQGRLQFRIRWDDWVRRNRFGGEFVLGGHAGEDFNLRHKATLLKRPEYLAEVGGKREWSITAKHDASNEGLVGLWVEDRLNTFRAQRKASPDSPHSFAVTVDPADGGGFCECAECRKKFAAPNDQVFYSNQVFHLANEVAKAVRKEFPDGYVNLYAYADHSAPPSFALEPNVYVTIIPYGFNYSGLQPDEFIRAWGHKTPRLSLYDYWSIPDWTWDQPSFNYLETPKDKIGFWHANRVEGFASESTFGAGAMGVAWYLSSRLLWDPKANQQAILDGFYRKSFGPAAAPMQRMLERWARGFLLSSHELGMTYRNLQEANKLAGGDAAVQARVDDFARYAHYLRLYYEMENAPDEPARLEANKKLVEHLFDIYETNMVHSFRLYQFLTDYGRKIEVYNEFEQTKKEAPGWQRVAPLSHGEVLALAADGANRYQPLAFEMRTYSGKMVPLRPVTAIPPKTGEARWSTAMPTRGGLDVEIAVPANLKRLPLRVSLYYDNTVTVVDANGKAIFTRKIKGIKEYEKNEEFEVPLPGAGRYVIQFRPVAGGGFRFQTLAGLSLVMRSFISEMGAPSPRLYFYVPRGLKTIAMWYPTGPLGSTPVTVLDATGEEVKLDMRDGGRMLLIAVPPGQDAKVWSLQGSRSPNAPHRMLNVPAAFSFSPDTLMVPADALQ
ncbi:MAG TPA: DUF4838 domain-containing protein [Abditibacteriaceae bacterium]|nr:DUF4838 domain-containing protein [Abditibacteriaceae bacterium]